MALRNGVEKFPDSLMLKAWYEKNKELFNKVKNAENEGMKEKEHGFDVDSNKGDADSSNECGISPVIGLIVYGDKKDDGGDFSMPTVEKVDSTNHQHVSQFLEYPELLATTTKMAD
ncbi:unnamed protein product [Lactuca saligna]|uniref:Uncharacterized protein n=1 Tax=Lactuca saligna TaxID=75948 RepID=A0AA35YXD5_LACSI|nr:unnamed protein product [Lactuca saligna]